MYLAAYKLSGDRSHHKLVLDVMKELADVVFWNRLGGAVRAYKLQHPVRGRAGERPTCSNLRRYKSGGVSGRERITNLGTHRPRMLTEIRQRTSQAFEGHSGHSLEPKMNIPAAIILRNGYPASLPIVDKKGKPPDVATPL